MNNRQPLPHVYPYWNTPEHDPHSEELVEKFYGDMRIVRNKQRARLLRRRGVPMWKVGREWLWFTERSVEAKCEKCDGTGLVTIFNYDGNGSDADDQPCSECAA